MKKLLYKIKVYAVAHKVISAVILVAILSAGYFVYNKITDSSSDVRYITAKVARGLLVASISGSGQVSSLNQIEVKSKVSGEITYLATQDGAKIGGGGLIAKLDTKDAEKVVRDAELNLESTKIALAKLRIEKSTENIQADLAKSYDDGFNTVSNVFLDLPEIMTGLDDLFFTNISGGSQWVVDWYEGQTIIGDRSKALSLKQNFIDSYNLALKAYERNFEDYKNIARTSDNSTVESLITQTYRTTKLISDVVKNANNYIDFVNSSIQKNNFDTPAIIDTHKASLNTYTSDINTHLVNLLADTTNIKDYKDAFPNAALDTQSGELSVKQKENALEDAKDKLADYFIRAPFAGTISKINIKKSDNVSASTIVATLITDNQLAEISMNEVDVAKIKIGQKASISFDAIPELTITGIVSDIDTVGTVSQGVVTYIVKISFDTQDERVKSGMSVTAQIITDMKEQVLVIPNSAVKSQAGGNYVEIFNKSLTTPSKIKVEVGLSNDSQSEIISGVKEDDEIIIRTIKETGKTAPTAPNIFGSPGGNRVNTGSGNVRVQTR